MTSKSKLIWQWLTCASIISTVKLWAPTIKKNNFPAVELSVENHQVAPWASWWIQGTGWHQGCLQDLVIANMGCANTSSNASHSVRGSLQWAWKENMVWISCIKMQVKQLYIPLTGVGEWCRMRKLVIGPILYNYIPTYIMIHSWHVDLWFT